MYCRVALSVPRLLMPSLLLLTLVSGPAFAGTQRGRELDDLKRRVKQLSRQVGQMRSRLEGDFRGGTPAKQRLAWYEDHLKLVKSSPLKDLKWQFLGPTNTSGRVTDVALPVPRGRTYTMYVATASGGVWKTVNEGTSFEPVFEHGPTTSIGDVTVAPSNSDIVWIGTGEANIFRSSMAGAGVWKSEDAGKSWKHMGLAGTHTIPRIVVHPRNPDVVYVASSGHEWTWNEDRGLYKSTDGGKTWDKVFFVSDQTGVIDLVMDPRDPDILYVATWQRIRKRWNDPRVHEGYDQSSIYKSTDAGRSWSEIANGLPAPEHRGRIGIDVCRARPDTVYAFIDNYERIESDERSGEDSYGRPSSGRIKGAEVYRSDDGGRKWRRVSKSDRYMQRLSSTYGWVFGQIRVDPNDEETVYVMGVQMHVSNDGGKTFRRLRGMHGDHHALWIDPDNSDYLVNGNDGGLAISYDGGKRWRTFYDNLPVVQFYNVSYDMQQPFHVYGSIQDHGSRRGVVDLRRGRNRVRPVEFESAPGGEASRHAIDPTDANVVYSEGFYGRISRSNMAERSRRRRAGARRRRGGRRPPSIFPRAGKGEQPLRGQWLAPFIISPHNPRIVYHGMNFLYRSLDRGNGFEKISPDLTGNDPRQIGDIPYQTIFAISESPLRFGLIYAGTDDGFAHVTKNGGASWESIRSGLASNRWIAAIEASRFAESRVYLAQNGKRHDDFTAYLWRSDDHGRTWADISANIPCGPINVVREDPKDANILYVGTDLGVYVTLDGAKTWQALAGDLPTTFVHDIVIHPRDDVAVIATHGRGLYVLDVRPLREHGKPAKKEKPKAEARPIAPARSDGGDG